MYRRVIPILLLASAWALAAEDAPEPGPAVTPPPKPQETTVSAAVLDYEVSAPGNPELGSQMADILTVRLSIGDSITLVERARLGKILDEQKLKLAGFVDQAKAVEVGKLTGAQLLIMGKGFMMDKKLMIVTKVVGVETSLVKGTIRTAELSKPISEAIMLLAEDVAKLIEKNAAALLPKGRRLADPTAEIRKKLAARAVPTVAVVIPEQHKVRRAPVVVVDPAAETEIKRVLLACGYKLVDAGQNALADWARDMLKGKRAAWPAALKDADVVIVGEAFSEFALRTGDLVTCAARAEINLIDRHTGRILKADRDTQRAVDLAEEIAGKTALQKAAHKLGLAVAAELLKYKVPGAKPAEEGNRK